MALKDEHDKISFIVTPLNLLGKKNQHELEKIRLSAIAMSSENANDQTFKVSGLENDSLVFIWKYKRI